MKDSSYRRVRVLYVYCTVRVRVRVRVFICDVFFPSFLRFRVNSSESISTRLATSLERTLKLIYWKNLELSDKPLMKGPFTYFTNYWPVHRQRREVRRFRTSFRRFLFGVNLKTSFLHFLQENSFWKIRKRTVFCRTVRYQYQELTTELNFNPP